MSTSEWLTVIGMAVGMLVSGGVAYTRVSVSQAMMRRDIRVLRTMLEKLISLDAGELNNVGKEDSDGE